MRNTFIHVFGKPVENPPSGGSVKKLHRASKDPSEKLVVEPGGGSQCALRGRAQRDQRSGTQAGSAPTPWGRNSTGHRRPKAGAGRMVVEEGGG